MSAESRGAMRDDDGDFRGLPRDRELSGEAALARPLIARWLLTLARVQAVALLGVAGAMLVSAVRSANRDPDVYAVRPNGDPFRVQPYADAQKAHEAITRQRSGAGGGNKQ